MSGEIASPKCSKSSAVLTTTTSLSPRTRASPAASLAPPTPPHKATTRPSPESERAPLIGTDPFRGLGQARRRDARARRNEARARARRGSLRPPVPSVERQPKQARQRQQSRSLGVRGRTGLARLVDRQARADPRRRAPPQPRRCARG